jgi:hypothetical protein
MKRLVLVKVETTVLMEFDAVYATEDFFLNDSSSCVGNVLERLSSDPDAEQCGCGVTTCTVVQIDPDAATLEAHQYIDIRE